MQALNRRVAGIWRAWSRVNRRTSRASQSRKNILKPKVYTPMEGGVIRLSTKGMLEMGEVPSPARVTKAIPVAQTSTPRAKSA